MNGGDVRTAREKLGWTRPQLLAAVDALQNASEIRLTIGRLAGIECRKEDLVDPEASILATALRLESATVDFEIEEHQNGEPRKGFLPFQEEGDLILTEWNGLKEGHLFKVEGCPRAKFHFLFYFKNEREEYVKCHGGKAGHDITRFFKPERLRTMRGRKLCG